jgi:hypothetical protein
MPKFHHANLGIPPELADEEGEFLVGILGYRRMEPPPEARAFGALWYEADDGTQVHLSPDPEHRPADKAHTAIEVSGECDAIEARLNAAGTAFTAGEFGGQRLVFCKDPAGNAWELRD